MQFFHLPVAGPLVNTAEVHTYINAKQQQVWANQQRNKGFVRASQRKRDGNWMQQIMDMRRCRCRRRVGGRSGVHQTPPIFNLLHIRSYLPASPKEGGGIEDLLRSMLHVSSIPSLPSIRSRQTTPDPPNCYLRWPVDGRPIGGAGRGDSAAIQASDWPSEMVIRSALAVGAQVRHTQFYVAGRW